MTNQPIFTVQDYTPEQIKNIGWRTCGHCERRYHVSKPTDYCPYCLLKKEIKHG